MVVDNNDFFFFYLDVYKWFLVGYEVVGLICYVIIGSIYLIYKCVYDSEKNVLVFLFVLFYD